MSMHRKMMVLLRTPVVISLLFFSIVFTLSMQAVQAQEFLGGTSGVRLVINPQFPKPDSIFEVSLDDYSIDTVGGSIRWFVGGVEQSDFLNERTIRLTAGALGEETAVRVTLTRTTAPPLSASVTIKPTVVDVILESHTYVPSFYLGRALPSSESTVRAVAIVHDGTKSPDSAYTYKWTLGNDVLSGGPVKGKSAVSFPLSRYGKESLAVEVFNGAGVLVGKNTISLNPVTPELHFYEESPLRGLSERAITSPYLLIGDETTISGEPFFMDAIIDTDTAKFTWKINNEIATAETERPNTITLRHVGGAGEAQVQFQVITQKRIPQLIQDTFRILFE